MDGVCQLDADRDALLEALLAPSKSCWLRYTPPSSTEGISEPDSAPEQAAAAGKAQGLDPGVQGHFLPAFALALGAELGFAPVLQPSLGTPRCVPFSHECMRAALSFCHRSY